MAVGGGPGDAGLGGRRGVEEVAFEDGAEGLEGAVDEGLAILRGEGVGGWWVGHVDVGGVGPGYGGGEDGWDGEEEEEKGRGR